MRFQHPETHNTVGFSSLPKEQQEKEREKLRGKMQKEMDAGESYEKEDDAEDFSSPDAEAQEVETQLQHQSEDLSPKEKADLATLLSVEAPEGSPFARIQKSLKKLPGKIPASTMNSIHRLILRRDRSKTDKKFWRQENLLLKRVKKKLSEFQRKVEEGVAQESDVHDMRKLFDDSKRRKEFAEAFIDDAPPEVEALGPPGLLKHILQHMFDSMFEWAGKTEGYESAEKKKNRYEEYTKQFEENKSEALSAEQDLEVAATELKKLGERPDAGEDVEEPEGYEPNKDVDRAKWEKWKEEQRKYKKWQKAKEKQDTWDAKHKEVLEKKKTLNEHMQKMVVLNEDQQLGPGNALAERKQERAKEEQGKKKEKADAELSFKSVEEMIQKLEKENAKAKADKKKTEQAQAREKAQAEAKKEKEEKEKAKAEKDQAKEKGKATEPPQAPQQTTPEAPESETPEQTTPETPSSLTPKPKPKPKLTEKDEPVSDTSTPTKSEAQVLQEFIQNVDDPELKKKLRSLPPAKQKELVSIISSEEEGGEMGKQASWALRWASEDSDAELRWAAEEDVPEGSAPEDVPKGELSFGTLYKDMVAKLTNPSDEMIAQALESMSQEADATPAAKQAKSLEEKWFRLGSGTAEGYFFDNPEKRETRQFAESGALHNQSPKQRAQGAPPDVDDIENAAPESNVSTLSRLLLEEEPVARRPFPRRNRR